MRIINRKISILFFFLAFLIFQNKTHAIEIGSNEAKVKIKVFSSLTCPHCATFHLKVFDKLKKNFIDKNKVQFLHIAFPLDLAALNGEKLLRCTNDDERIFKFLGDIYKKQNSWATGSDINKINESLIKIGVVNGLEVSKMKSCIESEKLQEIVLQERIDAQKKYRITSTPTIFINEKKYEGAHDYQIIMKTIEKLL